jgi:intracellular sulfur oxidation DsrE/DsrF family protein
MYRLLILLMLAFSLPVHAEEAPGAPVLDIKYNPPKVVYDVAVKTVDRVNSVLDRASYLSKITGADPFATSIVLVLHGDEINFFARKNEKKYEDLMVRAKSLVTAEVLKIRMCEIAAEGHGYKPEDIQGFVEMVPMGDAEIVRLQTEEGHAYMR